MAQSSIIYGIHAVSAALQHRPDSILTIHAIKGSDNPRLQTLLHDIQSLGVTIQWGSAHTLGKMAQDSHHQGIVASVRANLPWDEKQLLSFVKEKTGPLCLLVLEGIQDPHNLGACLRSAEALGADAVILPKDNTAPLNATVSKTASGADQTLRIAQVTNLNRCLDSLKAEGIWVIGTSGNVSLGIHQISLPQRMALVMGAEGKGLKRLTLDKCDHVVCIPLAGNVSSLNVSVATGICLYEYRRLFAQ